jgi:hypothetical protein
MSTKISIICDNPVDPEMFEEGYPAQLVLAGALPGLQRIESAKVWPKEDGTPTPAYRTIDLYFDDYDAASKAVTTPEASAFSRTSSSWRPEAYGFCSRISRSREGGVALAESKFNAL